MYYTPRFCNPSDSGWSQYRHTDIPPEEVLRLLQACAADPEQAGAAWKSLQDRLSAAAKAQPQFASSLHVPEAISKQLYVLKRQLARAMARIRRLRQSVAASDPSFEGRLQVLLAARTVLREELVKLRKQADRGFFERRRRELENLVTSSVAAGTSTQVAWDTLLLLAGRRHLRAGIRQMPPAAWFTKVAHDLGSSRPTLPAPNANELALSLEHPVSLHDWKAALNKLKLNKACGPDGVKGEVLRHLSPPRAEQSAFAGACTLNLDLSANLTRLFDQQPRALATVLAMTTVMLNLGVVPEGFFRARISPVPKAVASGGWRPVAVGNASSKFFCSMLLAELTGMLACVPCQYGFGARRGCDQALFAMASITRTRQLLDLETVVVLLDLTAAYDNVLHDLLMTTLARLLPKTPRARWLLQAIAMVLHNSEYELGDGRGGKQVLTVGRGLPQGNPLSPRLFEIYMTDLVTAIQSVVLDPVDDVVLPANPCGVGLATNPGAANSRRR